MIISLIISHNYLLNLTILLIEFCLFTKQDFKKVFPDSDLETGRARTQSPCVPMPPTQSQPICNLLANMKKFFSVLSPHLISGAKKLFKKIQVISVSFCLKIVGKMEENKFKEIPGIDTLMFGFYYSQFHHKKHLYYQIGPSKLNELAKTMMK